jgi:hypothetical protein
MEEPLAWFNSEDSPEVLPFKRLPPIKNRWNRYGWEQATRWPYRLRCLIDELRNLKGQKKPRDWVIVTGCLTAGGVIYLLIILLLQLMS